jgi:hypothetical protein
MMERRLQYVVWVIAGLALLGGAYAWWRWGTTVSLGAFMPFCA